MDHDPTSETVVRRASLDDAAALAALARRTFLAAFGPDNAAADLERYVDESFSPERISDQFAVPGATFLLLEQRSLADRPGLAATTPLGYAHLRPGGTPAVASPDPIELVRIYVEHHRTGTGHGGRLVQAVIDEARHRGHDTLWLGVWEHNLLAQRFYRRWGFTRVGEVRFVLGSDVQTDHVMSRTLVASPPQTPAADPGS